MPLDWSPLWLSLRYAGLATLVALFAALPLEWLARRRLSGGQLLDAVANLPLVLPPAVLTYYLLSALGRWPLYFNWRAAVALSAIYTLPLLLRGQRCGLASMDAGFENAARSLGAGEWRIFWRVTLPLAWRAILGAFLAGFARAFADFFATAVIANGASLRAAWLMLTTAAALLAAVYAASQWSRGQVAA